MNGIVHVWAISLDSWAFEMPSLLGLLSGEERVRAARLRTTELRQRFVIAHGALRRILAGYLGAAPEALAFVTLDAGKPVLRDGGLSFNLSHSGELALCAVTADGRLGVDVEQVRPVEDAAGIVRRYFAPSEHDGYAASAPEERPARFFSLWTRKEAFVKALGTGLGADLRSFEVDSDPAATSPWLQPGAAEAGGEWSLRSFSPRDGYLAAVALDRGIAALEFFEWSDAGVDPGAAAALGGS